ncbi:AAA family ATPase, partial [Mesorhizobium sp. M7A.F.Ca.US.001.04.2.1]
DGEGPETWSHQKLADNADTLVALRAVDPDAFARIEFATELGVVQQIANERQAAVASAPKRLDVVAPAGSISWINPTAWAGKAIKEREWEVEGWIPRNETTLLYGDGGVGKTLLIHQYATAAATGKQWLGQETRPARVMAFFCEDSEDELHRRQADINGMLHVNYPDLGNLRISSRKHEDNALGVWDRATGTTKLTPAWHRLRDDAVAWGADVLIIDTLSDVYVGEEIARAQVNSFVKTCLGRLASEIGGSVIALGHPSVSGKTSGSGTSGSTQWSNAVRSRLYLRYPDKAERGTIRELETMKLNYGPKGSVLKIKWSRGAFNVVAGMSTADRPAGFPASAVPDLADAVEAAVAAAINENAGVVLSPAPKSQHYAPKVLKRRSPDMLQAFGISEVEAAIHRMDRKGTIRHEEIGRDSSRRPIKGYVIVPDKMSETAPSSSTVFD